MHPADAASRVLKHDVWNHAMHNANKNAVRSHNGTFEVDLLVSASHDLYHGSSALSGLVQLAVNGSIILRLRQDVALESRPRALIRLDVRNLRGACRKVAIDFADRSGSFSSPTLEQSDVYFKRGFVSGDIFALPLEQQKRVIPYGLNFASLHPRAVVTHLRIAASLLAQRLSAEGSKDLSSTVREFVHRSRLAYGIPPATAFECRASEAQSKAGDTVLLQVRLWPPQVGCDDLESVNVGRVALVQTLKRGLGDKFVGGIITDRFSELHCPPDLRIQNTTNMRRYARVVKKVGIGVYVRGLHHSLAFKMAEYLAAGLCIVSEPLVHELPVPLREGVNYLLFRSHDECLERCRWLLSHPAEAERMRWANRDYYRRWVEPEAHMWGVLTRSFE